MSDISMQVRNSGQTNFLKYQTHCFSKKLDYESVLNFSNLIKHISEDLFIKFLKDCLHAIAGFGLVVGKDF
jgi:hypothetical protein